MAFRSGHFVCADALAADLDTDDRATVLALVAIARHALLLSGRPQLDQPIALDPDAVLVSEAVRLLEGGWDSARRLPPAAPSPDN